MAFRIGAATLTLQDLVLVRLLALAGAATSCGAQTGSVIGDAPIPNVPRPSVDDAPSNTTPLSQVQVEAAALGAGELLSGADEAGGAWRVIEVPTARDTSVVVSSPLGWLALSSRPFGDVEAPSGYDNALYRSTDGVHWTALPLGDDDSVELFGLAYGAGRYVMSGIRYGNGPQGVAWSSSDARQWSESPGAEAGLLQEGGAAYGNGVYVLAANGPLQSSEDGWKWQEHPLDYDIADLGGGYQQCYHRTVLFAEGRFYTEEFSSADGASWQAEPQRRPIAYENGIFFGSPSLATGLPAWLSGGQIQSLPLVRPARAAVTVAGRAERSIGLLDPGSALPATVNVEFEDGLTCENATCVLMGGCLVLVPPTGTPALADLVPRTAAGEPLLDDLCPVSNQIWCDDYGSRSGCVCHRDAPRAPGYCCRSCLLDRSAPLIAGPMRIARAGRQRASAQAPCSSAVHTAPVSRAAASRRLTRSRASRRSSMLAKSNA